MRTWFWVVQDASFALLIAYLHATQQLMVYGSRKSFAQCCIFNVLLQ